MSKARGLADLGNVYDDGALSNRNLIINGAMQVALPDYDQDKADVLADRQSWREEIRTLEGN